MTDKDLGDRMRRYIENVSERTARDKAADTIEVLTAERDKLRETLETIACMDIKSGSRMASVSMQRIARARLGKTK